VSLAGSPARGARGLIAVFLAAACLRSSITSVGPLLGRIGDDTGLSDTLLGLLSALPLLAFAAASPLVQPLARRIGAERLIGAALVGLAAGVALRSVPGGAWLWLGTAVLGAGIAVGNVLLPSVVRRDYATRAALVVGGYTAVMGAFASLASGVSLPLADAFGGSWRRSLGVWLVPAVLAAPIWLLRRRSAAAPTAAEAPATPARTSVWRTAAAWRLSAFMGLQSTAFYVLVSWLPSIVAAHHASHAAGGWYLFAYQVFGLVAGLGVPLVLRRVEAHRAAGLVTVPTVVAVLGLALVPGALPLWVLLAGLSSGASLVMALSLFSLDADDAAHAAALSGMAQSLGYLLAAGGPVAAGAVHDAAGSWTPALIGLAVLATVQACVLVVGRR
jgi:CP family cyanate transporter-like MFS transporter